MISNPPIPKFTSVPSAGAPPVINAYMCGCPSNILCAFPPFSSCGLNMASTVSFLSSLGSGAIKSLSNATKSGTLEYNPPPPIHAAGGSGNPTMGPVATLNPFTPLAPNIGPPPSFNTISTNLPLFSPNRNDVSPIPTFPNISFRIQSSRSHSSPSSPFLLLSSFTARSTANPAQSTPPPYAHPSPGSNTSGALIPPTTPFAANSAGAAAAPSPWLARHARSTGDSIS